MIAKEKMDMGWLAENAPYTFAAMEKIRAARQARTSRPVCPHCQRPLIDVSAPDKPGDWRCTGYNRHLGEWCEYRYQGA